jgi:hypothetical protein
LDITEKVLDFSEYSNIFAYSHFRKRGIKGDFPQTHLIYTPKVLNQQSELENAVILGYYGVNHSFLYSITVAYAGGWR